jgi:hypothetical protein
MRRTWLSSVARVVGQFLAAGFVMGGCAGGCPLCRPFTCTPVRIMTCEPLASPDAGDVGLRDSGPRPHDAGPDAMDAGPNVDAASVACNAAGQPGAHCVEGACAADAVCAADRSTSTIDSLLSLSEASPEDPLHPGYPALVPGADPDVGPAFTGALGSLCVETCDLAADDPCGACATCSADLTQSPVVNALGGARLALDLAGAPSGTGLCRIDCTYDRSTRGDECPDDMTCSAFTETCIERCVSDEECNARYGVTYAGVPVSIVDALGVMYCNETTGRCEAHGGATATVGDACATDDDCPVDGGVCLPGHLCAQSGCEGSGGLCAEDRGVCLGVNDHQTVCVRGCTTADDCGAGNACLRFLSTIGSWEGYCYGLCNDDTECLATETCDDAMDASGAPTPGHCVPRCTGVGSVGPESGGCADDEACVLDHEDAAYGFCRRADTFCGAVDAAQLPATSSECPTGWVCDELLAGGTSGGDGHCAPACTDNADCPIAIGARCVTAGPYAGLCRAACTSDDDCLGGEICDPSAGYCVEG